jgi:prevent-host-death family protein
MKRVKIAEFKSQLSRHLRAVEGGAEIEITDRDRPIARVVPIASREVAIELTPPKVPITKLRKKRIKPANWPVDSLEMLLEDRRKR